MIIQTDLWIHISTAFLVGFLGSVHCIGMCGPLIIGTCSIAKIKQSSKSSIWFLLGKLISYSILGFIVGLIGSWLIKNELFSHTSSYLSIAFGVLMIGVITYYWFFAAKSQSQFVATLYRKLSAFVNATDRQGIRSTVLLFSTGFMTALLPCGLLYGMALQSSSTASPLTAMLMMASFGIGTSPALFSVNVIFHKIPISLKRYASRLGEIILLISAAILIYRGIMGLLKISHGVSCCDH